MTYAKCFHVCSIQIWFVMLCCYLKFAVKVVQAVVYEELFNSLPHN